MEKKTFDVIILNGRPAAGKSEVIDYLKKVPLEERVRRFHIGEDRGGQMSQSRLFRGANLDHGLQ